LEPGGSNHRKHGGALTVKLSHELSGVRGTHCISLMLCYSPPSIALHVIVGRATTSGAAAALDDSKFKYYYIFRTAASSALDRSEI